VSTDIDISGAKFELELELERPPLACVSCRHGDLSPQNTEECVPIIYIITKTIFHCLIWPNHLRPLNVPFKTVRTLQAC
jgi:hypothetical protein